ncbi:MAG: phosphatidylserine decarboxylase [Nitrospinae bacterium RIFCSPLOWO2_12_FULL_45_22]|nr:MAG: phosphatidylserine decarboxylase [Nitrospinae bacterium RIFCSPLOWO2_12_FULL_45_22]
MIKRLPIVPEGLPIILTFSGLALFFYLLKLVPLYLPFFFLALITIYFFRDPERTHPAIPQAIISPADGRVIGLEKVYDESFFKKEVYCVSIFLSLFDVHINRSPYSGRVVNTEYRPGKFLPALWRKAAKLNEQNSILLSGDFGPLVIRQIAGFIARRIVCWVKPGDYLACGQKLGLIKFGSRVELLFPVVCEPYIKVGDKVRAGETIIAKFIA